MDTRYVVITPVRDEEQYLPVSIESMVKQSTRPTEWIIVNDGSKDRTGEIADQAAREHSWIRVVHRKDRGYRKWGAGIIEAFYEGFHALRTRDWEFMSKLDGDLSFEADYFEGAFRKFHENPKLGIGGGTLYHFEAEEKVIEQNPTFHVRGGAKIFRRACWDQIGGLWVGPGSDTVDEVKANMLKWSTMSFPNLEMHHHRPTGASWGSWGSLVKDGTIDYVYGSHPLFFSAKLGVRIFRRPYFVGSAALFYGYVRAYIKRVPQVNDLALIRYVRSQQLARLLGRETIWK
jgi:glycosyltransferase involved in cell wall biosynthesis